MFLKSGGNSAFSFLVLEKLLGMWYSITDGRAVGQEGINVSQIPFFTVLAPMAGYTDSPMRRLCQKLGCTFSVSEMISAKAMCYGDAKTGKLARITEGEGPVSIQLFGHDPKEMAECAVMVAEASFNGVSFHRPPVAVDINMGCPVKKIVSCGDGSALMRDVHLAAEIVKATSRALEGYKLPLTVKIRAGWDSDSINAPEFAKALCDAGASAIAVHCRTRAQMYGPGADISVIKRVKDAVPSGVTVIGNGDVNSPETALKMRDMTGCDGVMIGRAALGNPWIFKKIRCALSEEPFTPPSDEERIDTALSLIRDIISEKGEERGIRESRGRAAHFIKGMRQSAVTRDRMNHAATYSEAEKILREMLCHPAIKETT